MSENGFSKKVIKLLIENTKVEVAVAIKLGLPDICRLCPKFYVEGFLDSIHVGFYPTIVAWKQVDYQQPTTSQGTTTYVEKIMVLSQSKNSGEDVKL